MLFCSFALTLTACFLSIECALLQKPFLGSISSRTTTYEDQSVFRLYIASAEEATEVHHAVENLGLDIWSTTSDHMDVRVPQNIAPTFFDSLSSQIRSTTLQIIPDLNHAISRTIPNLGRSFLTERIPSINDTFFADFQTVEAITAWLKLVVALHPQYATLITLGKTHEGRTIHGLRVSKASSPVEHLRTKRRKVILVHGAQHAREWISVSTVCYLAYSLIAGHSVDPTLSTLVHDFDWIFVPTLNVDGYAYSFQDRLWRKNRQHTGVPFCKGIDLDRNWDFGWEHALYTASSSPCSENYEGAMPFEAHETRLLSELIEQIHADRHSKLVGYLDFHSYAQTILYPYALSCDLDVRDEESLIELGVGASRAIKHSSGEHYDTESACNQDGHVLSATNSGAALDWVYHSGVPWSYVVKLRDTGSYGFLVPKEEIVPTGEEMLGFVKYFATFISEHT